MTDKQSKNQRTDLKNSAPISAIPSPPISNSRTVLVERGGNKNLILNRIGDYKIVIEDNASCELIYLADSSAESTKKVKNSPQGGRRGKLLIELKGRNSRINFYAPIILAGTAELNIDLVCRHIGENSQAYVYLMSAVTDKACLDFKGNLIVETTAHGANTYLSARAILLSDYAKANILPALEIKTDDVQASHSAVVGKVDPAQMFYLQSRRIAKKEAANLIIKGYFDSIIKAVKDEDLKQKILTYLNNNLSLDA